MYLATTSGNAEIVKILVDDFHSDLQQRSQVTFPFFISQQAKGWLTPYFIISSFFDKENTSGVGNLFLNFLIFYITQKDRYVQEV